MHTTLACSSSNWIALIAYNKTCYTIKYIWQWRFFQCKRPMKASIHQKQTEWYGCGRGDAILFDSIGLDWIGLKAGWSMLFFFNKNKHWIVWIVSITLYPTRSCLLCTGDGCEWEKNRMNGKKCANSLDPHCIASNQNFGIAFYNSQVTKFPTEKLP